MGKFRVEITDTAKGHIKKHYKSGNKISIKKLENILIELELHPLTGIGNPEPLKHNYTGFWSRRINSKDRLIYKVDDNLVIVYVISAIGHY